MRLLLVGAPGSGKGTQGARLARHLGVGHIAAGDLLRAEVTRQSPVGLRMSATMAAGELVPDLLMVALLLPAVLRAADAGGFVLDGFPRSVGQAELIREFADRSDLAVDVVLNRRVPEPELVRRISARAAIEGREDDTEAVIVNRLRVFNEATAPLVDYYSRRGILRNVDADGPVDEVTGIVVAAVEAHRGRSLAQVRDRQAAT